MRFKTYIAQLISILFISFVMLQPTLAVTDDCYEPKRWMGFLYDELEDTYKPYTPSEFFTENGASIPGYDVYGNNNPFVHPHFYMEDTSCTSNSWSIRVSGLSSYKLGSGYEVVFGIDIIEPYPEPNLKLGLPQHKTKRVEVRDTGYADNDKLGLKAYAVGSYTLGFDYHDDTLFFIRNGHVYDRKIMKICKIINPFTFWNNSGGTVESLDYWDYENGTEYHENFTDCANTQEFPECEPDPVITLEATYELPTCKDRNLHLHANSNLIEIYRWEGPGGFSSIEQNPVIPYDKAKSGTYLVWGSIDPCIEPKALYIDIDIPRLEKDTTLDITTCHGDTVWIGNNYHTENGTYTDTLLTAEGCDSIVVSNLRFTYAKGFEEDSICEGGFYIFGKQRITEPGVYFDTVKADGVCDSIIVLRLYNYQIKEEVYDSICEGKSFQFGNRLIDEAGTYEDKIKTKDGCDSLVKLHLKIVPIIERITEDICYGSTYDFHGEPLTERGVYVKNYVSEEGCIVHAELILYTHEIITHIYDTICSGIVYNFHGQECKKNGVYKATVKTKDDCDSTIFLHLKVQRPAPATVVDINLCANDSFVLGNKVYKQPTNIRDTVPNSLGCDSIVVYRIKKRNRIDTVFKHITCKRVPVQIVTGEWISTDTLIEKFLDFEGFDCKLYTHISVVVLPDISLPDTTINMCGTHTKRVSIDTIRRVNYLWVPQVGVDNPYSHDPIVTFSGDEATYKVKLDNGLCQDSLNVTLTYNASPIISDLSIDGYGYNLEIGVTDGTPPYYYQIDSASNWHTAVDFEHLSIGVHKAYVIDSKGCMATDYISYYPPVIPATFMTPNGDGYHDTWEIKNLELYDKYTIKIFDRWGKLLKTYENYYDGWDGKYRGHKMPTTDYWYTITVELNEQNLSGHFTLLR